MADLAGVSPLIGAGAPPVVVAVTFPGRGTVTLSTGCPPMNGAESLVRTLLAGGIDVCFTNPGTSEMHFVAALDRVPGMRCVLGLFEGVVTGAADGYYRMADRPASTLLHLGPGLANGLANLHNARRARSGIVNVVGEHATYHLPLDAPLTSDIEGVARPMSHWVRTVRSPQEVAQVAREAIVAARTPPGSIATLALPADCAWSDAGEPAMQPISPPVRPPVDPAAVEAAARVLHEGGGPTLLLLGGVALRDKPLELAGRIAARTGCTVMSEFYVARQQRGAGRVVSPRVPYVVEAALNVLKPFRQVILVGAAEPVSFFGYPGKPSRMLPEGCRITPLAGIGDDLTGALDALAQAVGAAGAAPKGIAARSALALPGGPMSIEGIGQVIGALIPENAIVVDEAVTSGRALGVPTAGSAPHDWLTSMGGAIGFGLPTAVGAAIACPDRRVLSLEGDGSGMYTQQALWTMARESLDVTVLIFANHSYRILRGEFDGVGAGQPGPRATDMLTLDRPKIDWVGMAKAMGVNGVRAADLDALAREMKASFASKGPTLIEVVVS